MIRLLLKVCATFVVTLFFFQLIFPRIGKCSDVTVAKSDSLLYGVQTHFAQSKGRPETNLFLIAQSGITSIRDEFYWSQVEKQKKIFVIPSHAAQALDLAVKKGLEPLITLDYGNKYYDDGGMPISDEAQAAFVRYAEFVANYFKGRVHYYEVWNEWNIGAGNIKAKPPVKGDSSDYVRLLRKVSVALKRIDPKVVVLGGSVAGWDSAWIEEMLQKGAALYFDGISIHPYSYNSKWDGRPEILMDWLGKLEEKIKHYRGSKEIPFYLTEIGWPNHTGDLGTPPIETANYLSRLFLIASSKPFIKGIWWYDFQDDGTDQSDAEQNFGLFTYDVSSKPAWLMLLDVLRLLHNAHFAAQITSASGIFAYRYSHSDGSSTVAIWTDQKGSNPIANLRFGAAASTEVTLQQMGRGQPFLAIPSTTSERMIRITLSNAPWLVHGTFNSVAIDIK